MSARILNQLPAQEVLRQLFHYNPDTGKLVWRARPVSMFSGSRRGVVADAAAWNLHNAGKEAFYGLTKAGYHYGTVFGQQVVAHRVIWKWMTGEEPDLIDHQNGDRADNRWVNLRSVDATGNARNAARPKTNSSGQVGVCFLRTEWRWVAYIGRRTLGRFLTKDAAIRTRREAERASGFHPNHGRHAS